MRRPWLPSAQKRYKQTLAERIDAALADGPMEFADLAAILYPDKRSHRYQSNGGPPGCYMALSAGLRRGGFRTTMRANDTLGKRRVYPRTKDPRP